jgi:hypothetical protein
VLADILVPPWTVGLTMPWQEKVRAWDYASDELVKVRPRPNLRVVR